MERCMDTLLHLTIVRLVIPPPNHNRIVDNNQYKQQTRRERRKNASADVTPPKNNNHNTYTHKTYVSLSRCENRERINRPNNFFLYICNKNRNKTQLEIEIKIQSHFYSYKIATLQRSVEVLRKKFMRNNG